MIKGNEGLIKWKQKKKFMMLSLLEAAQQA